MVVNGCYYYMYFMYNYLLVGISVILFSFFIVLFITGSYNDIFLPVIKETFISSNNKNAH